MVKIIAGIDIGRTHLRYGIANADGTVISTETVKVTKENLEQLPKVLESICKKHGIDKKYLASIGLGISGVYKQGSQKPYDIETLNLDKDLNFITLLENYFNCRVTAENDVKVATRALTTLQGTPRNFIYLSLGAGVGSAIAFNRHVFQGDNYSSDGLGHVQVDPDGDLCTCGNIGCLETVFSPRVIVQSYLNQLDKAKSFISSDYKAPTTLPEILNAWDNNDLIATRTMNKAIDHLARAIANMVNISDINIVYIGGGVSKSGTKFFARLYQTANEEVHPTKKDKFQILPSTYLSNTGLKGAIELAKENRPNESEESRHDNK